MNEEQRFPDEYERRKKNMRPDALVIPDDVLRIMRIPTSEWSSYLKSDIQKCIDQAAEALFPGQCLESVPLVLHQQIADRVACLAAVYTSTEDPTRRALLSRVIGNAQVSARTNYQFVRHFIRRSLCPILQERDIPVPQNWSLTINVNLTLPASSQEATAKQAESSVDTFWRSYLQGLGGELAKDTVKFVKGMLLYLTLEAMGLPVREAVSKLFLYVVKGEFKHYDEMKEVLSALRQSDPKGRVLDLRVLKGREKGWGYVKSGLDLRHIPCLAWSPDSPRVRYYAFPATHMLLFSLGDGQFVAFSGGAAEAVAATKKLFLYDVEHLSFDKEVDG